MDPESKKSKIELQQDVAGEFKPSKGARRVSAWKHFPLIDLNKVTLPQAKRLVEAGFPYLEAKGAPPSSKKEPDDNKTTDKK
jgi:hypothetical protein